MDHNKVQALDVCAEFFESDHVGVVRPRWAAWVGLGGDQVGSRNAGTAAWQADLPHAFVVVAFDHSIELAILDALPSGKVLRVPGGGFGGHLAVFVALSMSEL